jgi:Flp pilus assembly protein TadG
MIGSIRRLLNNSSGAVAPTVALSLFGLIAAGGIAFDYARMAGMDTELQSAADQAALAAASQLDGNTDACARAAAAAATMLSNKTLFANDKQGTAINVQQEATCDATGKIRFWQDKGKTTPADDDSNAKFVEVEVDPREAFYALTPIVAAVSSGQMKAVAFAGLDSAICKVPPLMLCNPDETGDPEFTIANYIGKGIRLVANDGGGIYGPGNFGFLAAALDTNGTNGAKALRQILGQEAQPGDCVSADGVTTDPGNMVSVRDALNTRFDIYDNGLNNVCGTNGALCPPSINTRKDLAQKGGSCALVDNTGNASGWKLPNNPYPGATLPAPGPLTDAQAAALSPTGYPHDICHAFSETGSCTDGRIGDGDWDRYAYFRSHPVDYPEIASGGRAALDAFMMTNFKTTTPTRYQVYIWEMQHASDRLHTNITLAGGNKVSSQPVCAPPGVAPSSTEVDRRVLTVAVVNCTAEGVKGKTTDVAVKKWIDIFLTEPSLARTAGTPTENSDVYVEVIGQTQNATDEGAVQLVKKSVPYLIE